VGQGDVHPAGGEARWPGHQGDRWSSDSHQTEDAAVCCNGDELLRMHQKMRNNEVSGSRKSKSQEHFATARNDSVV